jgi:AcrR family transcriptional regulator
VNAEEAAADKPVATTTRREVALARALDQARSRAENRVELFLDAARELMNENSGEFTVQEVVERSGQSLRTFYQYFAGKHELLLALFEESINGTATRLQEEIAGYDAPVDRLHHFALEYFRMCRPTSKRRRSSGPPPTMIDFAQQLLTSHPKEAAHAFAPLVAMLEELLTAAVATGDLRSDLDHRRVAGVALQAIMFNAFAASISGMPQPEGDAAPEALWSLLLLGIGRHADRPGS